MITGNTLCRIVTNKCSIQETDNEPQKFDFAVIGGDMRQVYLAGYLSECGCRVCKYALCADTPGTSCYAASSLSEAVSNAETVLAPIPINKSKRNSPVPSIGSAWGGPVLICRMYTQRLPGKSIFKRSLCL